MFAVGVRRLALKTGQIKPHFASNRNDAVYQALRQSIFAQSPIDPAKFTAIIPPVDGRCAYAPVLPAPVAELVDAADSKSVSPSEWEFDSPRGHHRFFPECTVVDLQTDWMLHVVHASGRVSQHLRLKQKKRPGTVQGAFVSCLAF
tara:strand:- start:8305 stop:8742 length:438 start_codon:yes stop_codon:yes gene_type:complete